MRTSTQSDVRTASFEMLGLNARDASLLGEREVNAAFRREARKSHPDSLCFSSTSVDFRELVRAREVVLEEICVERSRTRSSPSGTEGADVASIWMRYAVMSGLRHAVGRHILRTNRCHAWYARIASWYDETESGAGWSHFVEHHIREYYQRKTRVIRLESTLEAVFHGDVHIWTERFGRTEDGDVGCGRKWLIPLWHSALYFEESDAMFVVDIRQISVEEVRGYVFVDGCNRNVDEATINVVDIRHRVSGDTNDVELWVTVRSNDRRLMECAALRIGPSVLPLAETTTGDAGANYRLEYPNTGPFVPNDDDIFAMDRRASVVVHVRVAT